MQTIYSLKPLTDEAKAWIEENTQSESYQWMGQVLCIEHRYAAKVVAGMTEAGLKINQDFMVW